MSDPGKAVFLSYASQDAEAAKRIADALRAAGVEVWFDAEGGLEHGDEWDAKIRRQIKECVLFIAIISANTQAREEGYFRLEWDLAAERARTIASGVPFILPVIIDDTREPAALVPDRFRTVQWTRLPGGAVPPDVLQRFLKLWSHRTGALKAAGTEREAGRAEPVSAASTIPRPGWKIYTGLAVAGLAIAAGAIAWLSRPTPAAPATVALAGKPAVPKAPLTEAQELTRKARALIDDDLMAVRENFWLADEFSRRAVALDATDGEAWATAARVSSLILQAKYEMTPERKETAKTQVERAGRLAPDSIETGLALATYLEVNNDPGEAERLLRRLIQQAPADKRLWRSLATNLANDGRLEEALATLRQPAGLLEEDPQAQSLLAYVLSQLGRYREEEAVLERVLQRSPTKLAYYYQLVMLGFYRSDLPAASRALEKIPPQLMQEDSMINSAAEIWLRLGEGEKTLQVLQKSPRDFLEEGFEVRPKGFLTGAALQLLGRPTAASAEWRQALVVVENRLAGNPNQPLLLYWKGVLQALTGQKVAALETRKLYREIEAKPNAWFDAILLVAVGENELAIQGLERAWPTAPISLRSEIRNELLYGPWLAAIRADPRMQHLISEQTAAIERDRAGPIAPPAKIDEKSVAVLAFANLSDDKANEYFSDGISEELLNVLAKVPGLTVRGRSSGFYFKGRQTKSAEIGDQLKVAYLVQGSVRRAGDRARISAQLIRAATDEVVWSSGSIDRDVKDIFAVQDEIAALIAKNLSVSMGVTARAPHQVNPEALTALLEGRQLWVLRTPEGFARAGVLFRRAVEIDPDWAPARAALANLMTIEASYRRGGGESVSERFVLAAQEAKRAIALDPSLGEPHAALGKIEMENLRHAEAEEEFRRALALEPNNALVRDWYGDLLVTQGRLDLAIVEYQRAADIEPLSPYILWDLAWELMHVRHYRESLALVERAIALTPNGAPRLTIRRARLLLELGRKDEAVAALRPFLDDFRADSDPQIANEMIWCLQRLGLTPDRERWTDDLLRHSPGSFSSGVILLMRGEEDRAYPLLEKCPPIFWQQLYWDPIFDAVRESSRFQQMLAKLGCAAEYKVARKTLARLLKEERK